MRSKVHHTDYIENYYTWKYVSKYNYKERFLHIVYDHIFTYLLDN